MAVQEADAARANVDDPHHRKLPRLHEPFARALQEGLGSRRHERSISLPHVSGPSSNISGAQSDREARVHVPGGRGRQEAEPRGTLAVLRMGIGTAGHWRRVSAECEAGQRTRQMTAGEGRLLFGAHSDGARRRKRTRARTPSPSAPELTLSILPCRSFCRCQLHCHGL